MRVKLYKRLRKRYYWYVKHINNGQSYWLLYDNKKGTEDLFPIDSDIIVNSPVYHMMVGIKKEMWYLIKLMEKDNKASAKVAKINKLKYKKYFCK